MVRSSVPCICKITDSPSNDTPPQLYSASGAADDNELSLGASLRCLFDLPSDYQGRDEADDDEKLVSRYAEDLREDACIDAAVAYGIALDTFLGRYILVLSVHQLIYLLITTN